MVTLPLSEILLAHVFNSRNRNYQTHGKVSKKVSIERSGANVDKPGQKSYFQAICDGRIKNPDIYENPPGHGPKKRTCPGKPGRMVTLRVFENKHKLGCHTATHYKTCINS